MKRESDQELLAMQRINRILMTLDPATRRRVLNWLECREYDRQNNDSKPQAEEVK
jgi:hypothetical protein